MIFTIAVGQCVQLGLGSTTMQVGTTSGVPVTLLSTVGLTNLTWDLSNPDNRFTNWVFVSSNSAIASATSAQTFFSLTTTNGQTLQSPSVLGSIRFLALPGPSAILTLVATNILGTEVDGSEDGNIASEAGRVVIVGVQPLLEAKVGTGGARTLILYDNPGTNYELLVSTNLTDPNWSVGASGTVTNVMQYLPVDPTAPALFYRVH